MKPGLCIHVEPPNLCGSSCSDNLIVSAVPHLCGSGDSGFDFFASLLVTTRGTVLDESCDVSHGEHFNVSSIPGSSQNLKNFFENSKTMVGLSQVFRMKAKVEDPARPDRGLQTLLE